MADSSPLSADTLTHHGRQLTTGAQSRIEQSCHGHARPLAARFKIPQVPVGAVHLLPKLAQGQPTLLT